MLPFANESAPMSKTAKHDDAVAAPLLPTFHRFKDLRARNIARNWTQLLRLIREEGFPPGRLISRNSRAWTADEINAWLDARPVALKVISPKARKPAQHTASAEAAISTT